MKTLLSFLFCLYVSALSFGQCDDNIVGLIYLTDQDLITFEELAAHAAPMLWFSPDEPNLKNEHGTFRIPESFPFEASQSPLVYYKLKSVYHNSVDLKKSDVAINSFQNDQVLILSETKAIDIEYLYYFAKESGLNAHAHDIESTQLQLKVEIVEHCSEYKYAISVRRVIAHAHGLHWFHNTLEVDEQTFFPISILIEEGKHGSCTDKNADGIYTPSYDVNVRVNDAWGVRDIISSGTLFSGGFSTWMAKPRKPPTLLFPPLPTSSIHFQDLNEKFGESRDLNSYVLRPYPKYEELSFDDDLLDEKMKEKKYHDWPKLSFVKGDGSIAQWSKSEKAFRSLSVSRRWDNNNSYSFSFPLLIVKNVKAPMTGGWFFNKMYLGHVDSVVNDSFNILLGHQIVHTTSASRWLDSYMGFGYELVDNNLMTDELNYKAFFVSEVGMKIRLNITKSPLKFLRHLGTDYWGVKFGWKATGFSPFVYSGFVLEIGAGVF